MKIKIDFLHAISVRCSEMLKNAGYDVTVSGDEEIIAVYCNAKHRRVRALPRKVHRASYTVPESLRDGERKLLEKAEAGGDLWPHQSRKISKTAAEDGMLNDFGIQHFHLGTTPDPKHPNLIQGTKELLFAVVTDSDFYSIGIYDHSSWSQQALLDVVRKTWQRVLEPTQIRGRNIVGLAHHYSDEGIAKLRMAEVNVLTQRKDGTIHTNLGGGVTMAKTSGKVTRDLIQIKTLVANIENDLKQKIGMRVKAARLPGNIQVNLEWRGDQTFAVTTPGNFEYNLNQRLSFPPL